MDWLVTLHSYWRYAVLITAIGAVVLSLLAVTGSRPWDALSDRFSLFFTITMDVQLLIGLGVWLLANYARTDVILTWVHPLLMIAAIGLAHVGRVRSERVTDSRAKGQTALLFFGLSLVIVLVAIPFASWPV